jgi:hypothetical protein
VSDFLIARNGRQFGPYSRAAIQAGLRKKKIRPSDLCWTEGMAEWKPVFVVFQSEAAPPPMPGAPPSQNPPPVPSAPPTGDDTPDGAPRNPDAADKWSHLATQASDTFRQARNRAGELWNSDAAENWRRHLATQASDAFQQVRNRAGESEKAKAPRFWFYAGLAVLVAIGAWVIVMVIDAVLPNEIDEVKQAVFDRIDQTRTVEEILDTEGYCESGKWEKFDSDNIRGAVFTCKKDFAAARYCADFMKKNYKGSDKNQGFYSEDNIPKRASQKFVFVVKGNKVSLAKVENTVTWSDVEQVSEAGDPGGILREVATGYFGQDLIKRFEKLSDNNKQDVCAQALISFYREHLYAK